MIANLCYTLYSHTDTHTDTDMCMTLLYSPSSATGVTGMTGGTGMAGNTGMAGITGANGRVDSM